MPQPHKLRRNEVISGQDTGSMQDTGSTLSKMSPRQRHELTARFAKDARDVEQRGGYGAEKNDQDLGHLGEKATRNPQGKTDHPIVVNVDKTSSSQVTEAEGKVSLQDLTKVAYNWIERFKQDNPNPSLKEVTMYDYAVTIYNGLKKHGDYTDFKRIIPIKLLGGADTSVSRTENPRYKRAHDLYLRRVEYDEAMTEAESPGGNWRIAWQEAKEDLVTKKCERLMKKQGLDLDQAYEQACAFYGETRRPYPEVVEGQDSLLASDLPFREATPQESPEQGERIPQAYRWGDGTAPGIYIQDRDNPEVQLCIPQTKGGRHDMEGPHAIVNSLGYNIKYSAFCNLKKNNNVGAFQVCDRKKIPHLSDFDLNAIPQAYRWGDGTAPGIYIQDRDNPEVQLCIPQTKGGRHDMDGALAIVNSLGYDIKYNTFSALKTRDNVGAFQVYHRFSS